MAVVHLAAGHLAAGAMVGLDVIKTGLLFRLWIDKGHGKYCSIDISADELKRIVKTLGSAAGGVQVRPPQHKNQDR